MRADGTWTAPSISSLLYANITSFPSTNVNILYADGTNGRVTNTQIVDNSIAIAKLNFTGSSNSVLCGDGLFRVPYYGFLGGINAKLLLVG